MKIQEVISEFDKTQKEQEEAVKAVDEQAEVKEDAKSEGEFVEAPKAEEAEVVEDKEDAKEEEAKEVEEDAVEAPEVEEAVEEEAAEKSVEEPKEEAPEAEVEEEPKAEDELEAVEEEAAEEVEKSNDFADLEGLLEVVLKSYRQSIEIQKSMQVEIKGLKEEVMKSRTLAEDNAEQLSKSLIDTTEKAIDEAVEDKAVGYATKSITPAPEAEVEVEAVAEAQAAAEPAQAEAEVEEETFVYSQHSKRFMEKFQHDVSKNKIPRRDVDAHRQAFLDASEGQASAKDLSKLYNYINE